MTEEMKVLMASAVGVTRQIDLVGRVTLPKELRESLGFEIGDKVEFFRVNGGILLIKQGGNPQDGL